MTRSLTTIALLAAAAAASPVAAQEFTGPRVEAQVGYDAARTDDAPRALRTIDGVRIGTAAGYDVALSPRVIAGVEAGIGFAVNDDTRATLVGTPATERYRLDTGRDIDVSARLGYLVAPNTLLYAKAGWANSAFRVRLDRSGGGEGPAGTSTSVTAVENGVRVGGGLEQRLGGGLYAKAEYRFTTYGEGVERHQALAGFGIRF